NKAVMIEKIAELVKTGQIEGISDIRDESDKDGIRVIIELKQNVQGNIVLNKLYKHTSLESSFGVINLAIVDKKPQILALPDLLRNFIHHRAEVVRRRSEHDKRKAEERLHILDGLLKAIDMIDAVVATIRSSPDPEVAQESLISKFGFTLTQADAILKMRLRRLAALEHKKIEDDADDLKKEIQHLSWILESEANILTVVKEETHDIREKYGDERRTKIDYTANTNIDITDLIEDKQVLVTLTEQNYIKRVPVDVYRQQKRGGRGVTGMTTKEEDSVSKVFMASTHDFLLCFTNKGRAHWLRVYDIPEGSRTAKGKAIVNLLNLTDEDVSAVIPLRNFDAEKYFLYATKNGRIGKMSQQLFSHPRANGIIGLTLQDNDELIDVVAPNGKLDVILTTQYGQTLRFNENKVRPTGRGSQGVIGIRLKYKDDAVCSLTLVNDDTKYLFLLTSKGFGKRTLFDEFNGHGRGTKGVRSIATNFERGPVVAAVAVSDTDDIIVTTAGGIVMRTHASDISVQGRAAQGVRVIKIDSGDKVTGIAIVSADSEENEGVSEKTKQE
ncbi:MAG TPA: DNA gyrase subunit A, partial [Methanocorpusculum sp.]|nr:DNA gyrase subunit A [Methanocorpusculum sp.]